jgi:hypothetical protein
MISWFIRLFSGIATTLIWKTAISLILQPHTHFIHQLVPCQAVSRRLKIKSLCDAQKRSFVHEGEVRVETRATELKGIMAWGTFFLRL